MHIRNYKWKKQQVKFESKHLNLLNDMRISNQKAFNNMNPITLLWNPHKKICQKWSRQSVCSELATSLSLGLNPAWTTACISWLLMGPPSRGPDHFQNLTTDKWFCHLVSLLAMEANTAHTYWLANDILHYVDKTPSMISIWKLSSDCCAHL